MSNVRIVKYNEDLFKIPSKTKKQKKPDKPIKIKPAKTNKTIKNSILKEIRKNQERQYNSLLNEPIASSSLPISSSSAVNDFENDFNDSVEFMKNFADKHRETKINHTIKNHNALVESSFIPSIPANGPSALIPVPAMAPAIQTMAPTMAPTIQTMAPTIQTIVPTMAPAMASAITPAIQSIVPTMAPTIAEVASFDELEEPFKILPHPGYGCLKNGSLPTYRSYHNKTMKGGMEKPVVAERIKSPTEKLLLEKLNEREIEKKSKNQVIKKKKIKKLLRRTYRIGRDKYRPRIGVLLPNKTIRSNVTTKSYMLKQTPIDEIRKTLVKQGFIKVGSSAPNDVLRKIYESIKMIDGDINNHNPDNLLYNFFNDKHKIE